MIVDNVIRILKEKGMYAKKHFGQNFLIDKNVLNKIISISNITKEDTVIEIGPGMGCLTEFLALNAKKVICYEIDPDMIKMLEENLLPLYNNIELIGLDFLKADLSMYKENVENVKVVANLPYYITTPIIFKLLSETKIKQFTFMVQKEVGDRLTGKPSTKDYNSLSVAMEYKTNSKVAYKVSPNSFYPAPNVDSALLVVEVKKMESDPNFDANFLKFVQDIFVQRRKTIINNLNGKYMMDKQKLINLFEKNNININLRAETLTVDEILNLYRIIIGDK
ncbi:MAG: ribosomal RNA small subunit methyltransferase A [Methanobrevibacter sp.]|nr:ribosomal RNA small subunit methyltransferase A [Methanobrevibacter sp.]